MHFDTTQEGRRVRLVYCSDLHTELIPGDCGTIDFVDDLGTVHVRWDKGSRLGLIAGLDNWEII